MFSSFFSSSLPLRLCSVAQFCPEQAFLITRSDRPQPILSVVCVYIIAVAFTFTEQQPFYFVFWTRLPFCVPACVCVCWFFLSKCCIFVILMFSVSLYNCVLQTGPATKWLCTGARSNVQVSCKLFKWTNVVKCARHSDVCNLHLSPSRDITNLSDVGRSQMSCRAHPEAVWSNLE